MLRDVLVGPEQTRLDHVESALTPESTGAMLPEALAHAGQARGDDLSTAMEKPVTQALRDAARRDPGKIGRIFAPIIGTAVRSAVRDAFAAILQRVNQLLERGFSVDGLRWRIEAMRTGRPYGEVLLKHTLVYSVEWVVLFDSETGLVLEQAAAPGAQAKAPDQVSAMLQALGSFVSEAFQPASPGAELETIEVGDLTVWTERNGALALAAAIRGTPPQQLRADLRLVLERIRTLHHEEIPKVHLDVAKFADTRPLLEDCLKLQMRPTRNRAQWVLAIAGLAAVLAFGVSAMRASQRELRDRHLRAAYAAALSSTPGIVVTSIEREDQRYRIHGLRDPRAVPPERAIASHGLPAAALDMASFESKDQRLPSPQAGTHAPIQELETLAVEFAPAQFEVALGDPLVAHAAALIDRAAQAAAAMQFRLCVEVVGHSDETGTETINERLRWARANSVVGALQQAGVGAARLDPGTADPLQSRPSRSVTFRALLRPDTSEPGCPP